MNSEDSATYDAWINEIPSDLNNSSGDSNVIWEMENDNVIWHEQSSHSYINWDNQEKVEEE